MTSLGWAILGYLALQLIVTVIISRFIKTETDYLLAGRTLGVGLASMSIFATWFGAETVMASSGAVASGGLSETRAEPFGYALCLVLVGLLVAYKMRAGNYMTAADFYTKRFSRRTGILAACVMIPTSLTWAGAQLVAFAAILAAIFGLPAATALIIATFFVIVYTTLSGLMGDVVTDNIEGAVVITGLVIMLGIVIAKIGGLDAAIASVDPARLSLLKPSETWLEQSNQWAIPIIGSLVSQEIISRLLATKDAATARKACLGGMGLYMTVGLVPVCLGLIGIQLLPVPENSDQFLPTLAQNILPTGLYVIFIGALTSAILSTINSNMLAISALTVHNLIMPFKSNLADKQRLRLDRIFVVIAGLGAYAVATAGDSIYDLLTLSSTLGSAGLVMVVLFGLWTGWGSAFAAIATLATGVLMTIAGDFVFEWDYSYLKSLAACLIVFAGVSMAEKLAFGVSRQTGANAI